MHCQTAKQCVQCAHHSDANSIATSYSDTDSTDTVYALPDGQTVRAVCAHHSDANSIATSYSDTDSTDTVYALPDGQTVRAVCTPQRC